MTKEGGHVANSIIRHRHRYRCMAQAQAQAQSQAKAWCIGHMNGGISGTTNVPII